MMTQDTATNSFIHKAASVLKIIFWGYRWTKGMDILRVLICIATLLSKTIQLEEFTSPPTGQLLHIPQNTIYYEYRAEVW